MDPTAVVRRRRLVSDGPTGPGGPIPTGLRQPSSILPFLRWSAFGYGALALYVAIGSWSYGEPPAWSAFASRAEALVVSASVEEVADNGGAARSYPRIMVQRPDSADEPVPLRGVTPAFFDAAPDHAAALAAGYRPGAVLTVRLIDGQPFADHTDPADIFHAVFMTTMALVMLATGFLIRPGRSRAVTLPQQGK